LFPPPIYSHPNASVLQSMSHLSYVVCIYKKLLYFDTRSAWGNVSAIDPAVSLVSFRFIGTGGVILVSFRCITTGGAVLCGCLSLCSNPHSWFVLKSRVENLGEKSCSSASHFKCGWSVEFLRNSFTEIFPALRGELAKNVSRRSQ